jgi:membrane fusion protein (multidrug efflux system)
MSEKALKIVSAPAAKTATDVSEAPTKSGLRARLERQRLRMILLVAIPTFAVLVGSIFYLSGGRYISTDNAYVGAQKVLITPDVSGKVVHVGVHEGQQVRPGDELLTLDHEPFQLALDQAKAKLAAARAAYDKLTINL